MWTDTLGKVELIVGEEAPAFTPPPVPSPLPVHIQFPYILSAAYHVIAETYAHKCADMCTGPGSTGRVHREGEGYTVHCKKYY